MVAKNSVGIAFAHHYISRQSPTLIVHFNFSSSLSFIYFRRANQRSPPEGAKGKVAKRPAPAKSAITAFCSRVASDIPRPAERWSALLWGAKAPVVANIAHSQWCRKQLFVQASGTKQLASHAITASRICTAQTNFVLFPLLARLFAVIYLQ